MRTFNLIHHIFIIQSSGAFEITLQYGTDRGIRRNKILGAKSGSPKKELIIIAIPEFTLWRNPPIHPCRVEIKRSYLILSIHPSLHPPSDLKIAKVAQIFKSGERGESNIYRPISLLPTIARLFSFIHKARNILSVSRYMVNLHSILHAPSSYSQGFSPLLFWNTMFSYAWHIYQFCASEYLWSFYTRFSDAGNLYVNKSFSELSYWIAGSLTCVNLGKTFQKQNSPIFTCGAWWWGWLCWCLLSL